jgi:hypothetical protein
MEIEGFVVACRLITELTCRFAHVSKHLQRLHFEPVRKLRIARHDELREKLIPFLLGQRGFLEEASIECTLQRWIDLGEMLGPNREPDRVKAGSLARQ